MQTIWKFPIDLSDRQEVRMPSLNKVLHVEMQHGHPTIWAAVDPESTPVEETIVVVGTGHQIPSDIAINDHIGTVQDGSFVWHLFMKRSR